MSIDRKAISQATTKGEGEPNQALSIAGAYWGFRKPNDPGPASKYWDYEPQTAKQLLSADGVSLPMRLGLSHWKSTVIGQQFVDTVVLIEPQWRNTSIAEQIPKAGYQGAIPYVKYWWFDKT